MDLGLVHAYFGDGKGKTSCAFGLASRCAGCGGKVKIIQFLKTEKTGEVCLLGLSENIKIYRFEESHGFVFNMDKKDKEVLKGQVLKGIEFAKQCLFEQNCDMLVLDEILCAWQMEFVSLYDILNIIDMRKNVEIVLTGHKICGEISEKCDYVTEMRKIKHPYDKNICARKGIEF